MLSLALNIDYIYHKSDSTQNLNFLHFHDKCRVQEWAAEDPPLFDKCFISHDSRVT